MTIGRVLSVVLSFVLGWICTFLRHVLLAAFLTQTVALEDGSTVKFEIWYARQAVNNKSRLCLLPACLGIRRVRSAIRYALSASKESTPLSLLVLLNQSLVRLVVVHIY